MDTSGFPFIFFVIMMTAIAVGLAVELTRRSHRKRPRSRSTVLVDGALVSAEINYTTGTVTLKDPPKKGQTVQIQYTYTAGETYMEGETYYSPKDDPPNNVVRKNVERKCRLCSSPVVADAFEALPICVQCRDDPDG